MSEYSELLRLPQWQKKRLYILDLRGWKCEACGETEKALQVHHLNYIDGHRPWDYPDDWFEVLCDGCHDWREKFNALFGRTRAATKDCRYLADFFKKHISLPDLAAGKVLAEAARVVASREEWIADAEIQVRFGRNIQFADLYKDLDSLRFAGSWLTQDELKQFNNFTRRRLAFEEQHALEGSINGSQS